MSAGFSFDKNRAMKADEGGYINRSGVYVGVITKMISFAKESGSGGVELSLESVIGEKCNFVQVYTRNRDGSENYAKGKIDAALGILGLDNLQAVRVGDKIEFPGIYGKRIAFALQREDYRKDSGEIGWKMNLLHFFFPDTMKTFREYTDGSPANVCKMQIEDIRLTSDGQNGGVGGTSSSPKISGFTDDDLPF